MKRAKLTKKGDAKVISKDDAEQIEGIYKLSPVFVNGCYLTPTMHEKSTMVRITYAEYNFTLGKNLPRVAIVSSIEDVQTMYNALTELLQQMRTMGRIA